MAAERWRENFDSNKHGHGRICLQVKLMPHRRYRMRVFAKTEGLVPNKSKFMLQFYRMNGGQIATLKPDIAPTQDWTEYSLAFFSGDETEGRFFVGMWGGEQGKLWIDDIRLEMDGVTDVIRRPGTPFTVKNAATGQIYEEGKDYGNVEGLKRISTLPKESIVLDLPEGSTIKDGDELLISFYQPVRSTTSQHSMTMAFVLELPSGDRYLNRAA